MNNLNKLNQLVAGILGVSESELKEELRVSQIPNWDSFNNLQIISEIEQTFNIQFTTDEILKAIFYRDVIALVKKHGVD